MLVSYREAWYMERFPLICLFSLTEFFVYNIFGTLLALFKL